MFLTYFAVPFTRSKPSQTLEKPQKSANFGPECGVCGPKVSYPAARIPNPTLSNRAINRRRDCNTRSSPQPSSRGLWLRGTIYQFRVKVPVDLRDALGCVHVNRSLRTDSPSLAIRLARKVAFEIDAMFEATRREIGVGYDERLIIDQGFAASRKSTIEQRSGPASGTGYVTSIAQIDVPSPTLSMIYERFLNDPTKRRSARTMLAHHTTRRVVEDVLGSSTPISQISREACRELLDILRWMPVNAAKKYPRLTVRNVAELAKRDRRIKTINATNLNAGCFTSTISQI